MGCSAGSTQRNLLILGVSKFLEIAFLAISRLCRPRLCFKVSPWLIIWGKKKKRLLESDAKKV